ncbi:hypothetical protein NUACC21_58650 [Scytonema sp. NUACC21]
MAVQFYHKSIQLSPWLGNILSKVVQILVLGKGLRSIKRLIPVLFAVSFVTVILVGNLPLATAQIPQLPSQEIRGVWLTNNDFDIFRHRAKAQDAIAQLRRLNFNTIYPVVWNDGYTKYPSAVAQRMGIPFFFKGAEGQDVIADIITQARRQGLLAVPWFEFGFMAPLTSELASNHPDWLTQKQDGTQTSISAAGEVAWLNPFHPEVQKFITDLVVEIVTQYDADGIQFDDHMSLPVDDKKQTQSGTVRFFVPKQEQCGCVQWG